MNKQKPIFGIISTITPSQRNPLCENCLKKRKKDTYNIFEKNPNIIFPRTMSLYRFSLNVASQSHGMIKLILLSFVFCTFFYCFYISNSCFPKRHGMKMMTFCQENYEWNTQRHIQKRTIFSNFELNVQKCNQTPSFRARTEQFVMDSWKDTEWLNKNETEMWNHFIMCSPRIWHCSE